MEVYIARHAETNYNVLNISNDDPSVDVHLTENGIKQGEELAEKLKDVELDLIITSRLPRTKQTAGIVNKYHGVPTIEDARLDDVHNGFEGRSYVEFKEARASAPDYFSFKINDDAESFLDVKKRTKEFLADLAIREENVVLVVTSHHNFKQINGIVNNLTDEQIVYVEASNASYFKFEV